MAKAYQIIPIEPTIRALSLAYRLDRRPAVVKNDNPYSDRVPQGVDPDPAMYLSNIGSPVVADITFVGGSYTSEETGRVVNYSDIVLYTVLITVGRPKKIVKTDITGR